ncbi:DNA topoisomerase [Psychrilyobacter atlanticus]|uniref:DNA topoisomerase n=1 Tax=Psychrilyobacter atlanticus TaxID=271091 RepID=UPI000429A215|nr:DNA topoisomerase [Psychrilyobacter atlanticus]
MKKLIIAEKPSLGRNIASALGLKKRGNGYIEGEKYIVSWAFGHLFELSNVDDYFGKKMKWKEVELPFTPRKFKFKLKESKGIAEQFKVLKNLMEREDVEGIINCGDADREGQIIIDRIIKESKIKKEVYRLWLPEQTKETIVEEVKNIKPDREYIKLAFEGYSRTVMDWLFGINLTRYITLKSGQLMPVGRVLIPVLKFIYDRDTAIEKFVKEKYIQLESECEKDEVKFKLSKSTKYLIKDEKKADSKCEELNSCEGEVLSKENKEIKKQPGKLFSLSKLQSQLSKKNKIDFKGSLEIIQKLYENGYITYPRTNTEYLAVNEKGKVKQLLKALSKDHNVKFKDSKKIFDDDKVESHSAIIPTMKFPKNNLNGREKIIYETILNRFISNFLAEETITAKVVVTIGVGNEKFKLSGESVVQVGFYKYEPATFENKLPNFIVGDTFKVEFKKILKETKPPRKVSERELAAHLKNPFRKDSDTEEDEYKAILKGIEIGTEATRTGIIENAKKYEYISQKGSNFSLEPLGQKVVETLDKLNIDLYKTKTVEFSKLLKKVYKGNSTIQETIDLVTEELQRIIGQNIEIPRVYNDSEREIIGVCPRCGKNIYENSKGFSCVGYRDTPPCNFTLWKESKYKSIEVKISKTRAKKLIKGETIPVKKIKGKNEKVYSAEFKLEDTGKYVNLKLEKYFPVEE